MSTPYLFSHLLPGEARFIILLNTMGLVETLFYGIHLVLFLICLYLLARNKRPTQLFILGAAIVMFGLSTADVSLTITVLTHDFADPSDPTKTVEKHISAKIPIFVTNNFIADLILLYRCYMVWGKSKYVLIGASLLVFAESLWGYLGIGDTKSYLPQSIIYALYVWSIFAINIILTAVTVGRIFWVSRIAMSLTGIRQRGYRTAMAILAESSLVYSACIFAYLLFPSTQNQYKIIMAIICMKVVCIMPTLLIVQVGLGRAIRENYATPVSDLGFGGHNPGQSIILDTIFTSTHPNTGEPSILVISRGADEESCREPCADESKK